MFLPRPLPGRTFDPYDSGAPALAWTATDVRRPRVIDEVAHAHARRLDRPARLFTAGAGAADHDVDLGDAQVLGLAGRVGRRELGRVGGALLRALVADRTGGRPRDGVAVDVGDRDD